MLSVKKSIQFFLFALFDVCVDVQGRKTFLPVIFWVITTIILGKKFEWRATKIWGNALIEGDLQVLAAGSNKFLNITSFFSEIFFTWPGSCFRKIPERTKFKIKC